MKLEFTFAKEQECALIHEYSKEILHTVGIVVHSEPAREIYRFHGSRVEGNRVFLSPQIVDTYMKTTPDSFLLYGLHEHLKLGKGQFYGMPTYGATKVRFNGTESLATHRDFVRLTKLNHNNKRVHMSCPYIVEPSDVPMAHREMVKMATTLCYSNKPPLSITKDRTTAEHSIEFVQKFYDNFENYLVLGNVNISSPLFMTKSSADAILVHSEKKQPLMISCGSGLSGLTAPPTMGSNFLINNAATLSGIVLAQMASPGLPVVYGFPLFGIDPNTASASPGHLSTALFTMAAAEMGRYYRIPVRSGGTYTDSSLLDYQSGFESFMNLFSSAFSKVDMIMHACGMENSLNTVNYNKYILDEALFEQVDRFLGGFRINDVTLMMDEIRRAGSSGNFINIHNLRLIPKEYCAFPFKNFKSESEMYNKTEQILEKKIETYKRPTLDKKQRNLIRNVIPEAFLNEGEESC